MKTVAVFSVKGGVGKTACAVNLAHVAATQGGRRTLLWDLDAQGAATFTLRLKPRGRARDALAGEATLADLILSSDYPNLDVLPADRSLRRVEGDLAASDKAKQLRKLLKALEQDYDRVVIDCPPGLTELAERLFRAADLVVSPLLPSPLSARALDQLTDRLQREHKGKPPVLAVWSMADRRKALHRATMAAEARPVIPYAAAIERMAVERAPIGTIEPRSPASLAFVALWRDVEARLQE